MRILGFLILFLAFVLPAYGQEYNAGFVKGLWYSSDELFVGEPVRIYVALRNNIGGDLSGTIEFFDGNKLLERTEVSALDGRVIEAWADWSPTYGEHQLRAELKKVVLHQVGDTPESIDVTAALAEDLVFVDYDTDNDGVGDETDQDDDDDGIPDDNDEEPLVYNEPEEEVETVDGEAEEENNDTTPNDTNNQAEGLEQFLVDSPADSALASVSSVINTTRERLDAYRERRNENHVAGESSTNTTDSDLTLETASTSSSTTASSVTSTPRIGEITRSQSEGSSGMIASVLKVIGAALERGYTLLLFLLSTFLAHPAVVQIVLLILILFIIFKLARRLAGRPE